MKLNMRVIETVFLGSCLLSCPACTKISFTSGGSQQTALSLLSAQEAELPTVYESTKKNHPITFTAGLSNGQAVGTLSFGKTIGKTSLMTGAGTYQITNPTTFTITFTPTESFVGLDKISIFATDAYGTNIPGLINMQVGNTLNSIQPALAVRGMSCITCHSNVSSNIVTDYGYGNPWYFDTSSDDSFYFDRLGSNNGLATLNLLNNSQVVVPAATIPAAIQSQFSVTSLAQFVVARLTEGCQASPMSRQTCPDAGNLTSQVREIASLKINLPTGERIQQIFGNPIPNQAFIPDTQNSPALSGLEYDAQNGVFKITDLVCDGDLYLGAPVLFNNAIVQSLNGCRIYSTGNVFIDTPIQSIAYNGSVNYNTQVMSSQSIWMGAGRIIQDGRFCELDSNGNATGWYTGYPGGVDCKNGVNSTSPQCDTLTQRTYQIEARNTFATAYPDAPTLQSLLGSTLSSSANGTVMRDRAAIEKSLGTPLMDASCGASGRNVSVARLMLAAPYVNNRFTGSFSGSTIAEAALMSLGTFTYSFDPVFTQVSIFSMLDNGELLSGEGI